MVESLQNRGFGPGVNLGAATCTAPLLFILNSDATVLPGSLRTLAEALMADETVGLVAPAIYGPDGTTLEPRTSGALPARHQLVLGAVRTPHGKEHEPGWVSGVAMLIRMSDFRLMGGFDEAFWMYFEDMDLCRRLRETGKVIRRVPAASVTHGGGRSWTSNSGKRRHFHDSKALYFKRIGATPLELLCVKLLGRIRTAITR